MRKLKWLVLLFIVVLLSGCVKYDTEMKVGMDKSITITSISSIQKEYAELQQNDDAEEIKKFQDNGYDAENYQDDKYQGIKLTKKYDSIDMISSPNCGMVELTDIFEKKADEIVLFKSQKQGSVTTYTANFTYNLKEEDIEAQGDVDYSEYGSTMIFEYSFSLPDNVTIVSDNADSKTNNDKTLNWKINFGELKKINFVFRIDDQAVTEKVEDNSAEQNDDAIVDNSNDEVITDATKPTTSQEDIEEIVPKASIFSYIISALFIGAIVFAFIKLKGKVKKRSIKINNSGIHHDVPPEHKNM